MVGHVDTWIFDLDETLYHPSTGLIDQINARMTDFIVRELRVARAQADLLREEYWQRHGTTLAGLVAEHGVVAAHFLDECHRLDLGALALDADLAEAIAGLPGRRIVHTNGPRAHAERILTARGLEAHFEAVITIEDTGLVAKPDPRAYAAVLERTGIDPARTAMIEDKPQNLEEPKRLGMTTIWLAHEAETEAPAHVDHRIECLTTFVRSVPDRR